MDANDFAAWVTTMKETRGWSERECTRQLGCGINQITRWRQSGAPEYIGRACAAITLDIPSWTAAGSNNGNTETDVHGTQAL